jgi:16S rRNA (guanine527-N7)-methyltransferase
MTPFERSAIPAETPGARAAPDWRQQLLESSRSFGIELSAVQLDAFDTYLSTLLDWNRRINLTSVTDAAEIAALHFLDSLACLSAWRVDANVCVTDVGSGAGLPGIPIAIARPDLRVTLLESTRKKCRFLEEVIARIPLPLVSVDCRRAEEAGRDQGTREAFDIATTRAVSELAVVAELCLPLIKLGGAALIMKGPRIESEIARAENAVTTLGGEVEYARPFALPTPAGPAERVIVILRKVHPTPEKYPRAPGMPAKRPLGIDRGRKRG